MAHLSGWCVCDTLFVDYCVGQVLENMSEKGDNQEWIKETMMTAANVHVTLSPMESLLCLKAPVLWYHCQTVDIILAMMFCKCIIPYIVITSVQYDDHVHGVKIPG